MWKNVEVVVYIEYLNDVGIEFFGICFVLIGFVVFIIVEVFDVDID